MRIIDFDTKKVCELKEELETEVTMENLLFWLQENNMVVMSVFADGGLGPGWLLTDAGKMETHEEYLSLEDLLVDINCGVY